MHQLIEDAVETGYFINPMLLYDMTPHEISKTIEGFAKKNNSESKDKNIRTCMIVAAIYEVNRNPKKRKKPYTWRDFYIDDTGKEQPKQSVTDMKNICKTICKALGGKINGT